MPALKMVLLQEDKPCQRAVMMVKTTSKTAGETTPQPNLTIHKRNFIYLTLFNDKKCFTGLNRKYQSSYIVKCAQEEIKAQIIDNILKCRSKSANRRVIH